MAFKFLQAESGGVRYSDPDGNGDDDTSDDTNDDSQGFNPCSLSFSIIIIIILIAVSYGVVSRSKK